MLRFGTGNELYKFNCRELSANNIFFPYLQTNIILFYSKNYLTVINYNLHTTKNSLVVIFENKNNSCINLINLELRRMSVLPSPIVNNKLRPKCKQTIGNSAVWCAP